MNFPSSENAPRSTTNNALAVKSGVSVLVLDSLQDVARLAPVPYLSIVCSAASWIVETVQTFKENKAAYKALGEDTCGVVYAICQEAMKENKTWTAKLEEKHRQLWMSIKQIQSFIGRQWRRRQFSRLLTYKPDSEEIQRYRDSNLKDCLKIFELPSNITVRELVRRISEEQSDRGPSTSGAGRENNTFHTTLPGLDSASFSGNIRVNNVAEDQRNSNNESHSFTANSYNNDNHAGGHSIGS
ncbi:hypothetical protein PQX77_015904 [Marasmius sp. AFHP31]|nr:hypothetical protein PQX77_015904 [Marasmius sp. AFHP31]